MVIKEKAEGEAPEWSKLAVSIETLPNLRRVDTAGKLYRSSRQDLLSRVDGDKLSQLGIRSVIDFRSKTEYKAANGDKIFDEYASIFEVVVPKGQKSLQDIDQIPVKPVDVKRKAIQQPDKTTRPLVSSSLEKRYLINFFKLNYVKTVFNRIPLYKRLFSIIYLVVDIIMRTHFRNFVRFFARQSLNPAGVLSSYIDMVELSGNQICLALRILSDPSNLPALVSCAHGKDRTGIVIALVLSLLGKSNSYIVQEYALTEIGLDPIRSRVNREVMERLHLDEAFTHARQETMEGLLHYIEKTYGDVPSYLDSIGFGRAAQEKLLNTFQAE